MGFGRRLLRKSIRQATPRSVRRAMHPVRTLEHAVTPRPIRRASRSLSTVTNPLGAAENALIGAMLSSGPRTAGGRRPTSRPSGGGHQAGRSGVDRAAEGIAARESLSALMAVQRERFAPAAAPVVPVPPATDVVALQQEEWQRRKGEVSFWRRRSRRLLRAAVVAAAEQAGREADRRNAAAAGAARAAADRWWRQLQAGDGPVLTGALAAAFADNPVSLQVVHAEGAEAALLLLLPGPGVVPLRRANVTPTGRMSSRAWTKTELAEVYAELLGAHLTAALREAWAVGPSLREIRVIGVRHDDGEAAEALFDVTATRDPGSAADDAYGSSLLARATHGLRRTGRIRMVTGWPRSELETDMSPFLH